MWYPTDIYDLLELIWFLTKIFVIITFAPSIYEVFEMIFFRILSLMLRIIKIRKFFPHNLERFFYKFFFLGLVVKRFLLIGIANILGYKISVYTYIRDTVTGGTKLSTDGDIQDSFILAHSSYLLVFASYLLFIWRNTLVEIFYIAGFDQIWSLLLTWWIIISLFLTGRPRRYEVIFPLITIAQLYPNAFLVVLSIIVSSVMLYPSLGLYFTSMITIIQLCILLLMELRRSRQPVLPETGSEFELALIDDLGYLG